MIDFTLTENDKARLAHIYAQGTFVRQFARDADENEPVIPEENNEADVSMGVDPDDVAVPGGLGGRVAQTPRRRPEARRRRLYSPYVASRYNQ